LGVRESIWPVKIPVSTIFLWGPVVVGKISVKQNDREYMHCTVAVVIEQDDLNCVAVMSEVEKES